MNPEIDTSFGVRPIFRRFLDGSTDTSFGVRWGFRRFRHFFPHVRVRACESGVLRLRFVSTPHGRKDPSEVSKPPSNAYTSVGRSVVDPSRFYNTVLRSPKEVSMKREGE
jgi:hypothetical protein